MKSGCSSDGLMIQIFNLILQEMKGILVIFLCVFVSCAIFAQKELQKGNTFFAQKQYDSASYYYRKGYRNATQNRDLNTQKKYIPLIIQAECYAQNPDTALKYANLMYFADFPLHEIYDAKENIFRMFLYYDSAAFYASKYIASAPKTDNKTEIKRLKNAVLAYYDAYYYDLALFYCKPLLTLCEAEYSRNSPEYAEIKLLIAAVLAKKGEITTAQTAIEQAMLIYQKYPEQSQLMAYTQYAQSIILTQNGKYLQAMASAQNAVSVYKKQFGEQYLNTAKSFLQLGILYEKTGKYDSAFYFQQKALTLFKSLLSENDLYVAQALQAIGTTYFAQKNYEKAEEYYQNALFIQKQHYIQYHPQIAETYKNLGAVMEAKKDVALCYRFYELALGIHLRTLGQSHIEVAQSYINMGTAWFLKKEPKKSMEFYLKGVHILEHNPEFSNHEYLLNGYNKLSVLYQTQKDYEKAIQYAIKAIVIAKNKINTFSTYLSEQYIRLVALYHLANQYSNEVEAYQNAIDALCLKPITQPFATPVYKDVILEEKAIPLLVQKANLIIEHYNFEPLQEITLSADESFRTIPHDSRKEYELNSALNALELVIELKHKLFKQGQYITIPADVEQKIIFLCLHLYQISQQRQYVEKLLSYAEIFSYQQYQYKFFFDTQKSATKSFSPQDTLKEQKIKIEKQFSELKKQLLNACKNEYKTDTQWVKSLLKQYERTLNTQEKVWQNIQKYSPEYYANFTVKGLKLNTTFETQTDKFIAFLPLDALSKTWKTVKNEQHVLYKAQALYYLPLPDFKSIALIADENKMHCIPLETNAQIFKEVTLLDSALKQKNLSVSTGLCEKLSPILFDPLKSYLNSNTLLIFTQGIFNKLSVENLFLDKKNTVISKYKIFYAYSLTELLNQAVEKPKTEFIQNIFETKRPVSALNNPKYRFLPASGQVSENADIFHTDSFIDYPKKSPPFKQYLYISAYCNTFIPYIQSNCISLRYPTDTETEQQFWNIFYETLMKNSTIWNAFYTAQQKIYKQDNTYPGCFRLYLSKI
jgi:tetratricopeptide (TPR) repeat protein